MFPDTKNKIGFVRSASAFLLIAALVFPREGEAASKAAVVRRGNGLYAQGKFADSLRMYEEALKKDPESEIIRFNAGTALYKQKLYDQAAGHFQNAILSDDARLREKAHYNLGVSLYQSGAAQEQSNIPSAVKSWEESLKHFERALAIDKKDDDAQYNYDFVKKELERLRREQKKQQQQSQQKQQGQEGSEDQPRGQQGNQQQQQQPSSQGGEDPSQSKGSRPPQQDHGDQPSQQQPSPEQSPQEQSSGGKSGESQPQPAAQGQDQQQAGTAASESRELTKSEAERLLHNYQQTEEPRGLLHVFQEKHHSAPVIKDW